MIAKVPKACRIARNPGKSRGLVRTRDGFDTTPIFEFVKAHQALWPIAMQCRVLDVSPSGYYAWLKRPPSKRREADALLGDRLQELFRASEETYGRPRLQADLRDEHIHVSDKRVARLMRERNIVGACRKQGPTTTVRDMEARPAPDLVERKFVADAPDQLWVADITYVPTVAGFLFVAIVLDVFGVRHPMPPHILRSVDRAHRSLCREHRQTRPCMPVRSG